MTGTFVELEQDKKIVMKWRLRHWPAAHFSTASMAFEQTDKGAKMTLEQSGVPESDIERTKQVDSFSFDPFRNNFKGMERVLLESDQIHFWLWNYCLTSC